LLIVFGGLPATGKSTLARAIAAERQAAYLRVDTIEQALRGLDVLAGQVGPAGYLVAYAVAAENLRLGRAVVADSVNALVVTREAWRDVAAAASVAIVEIELVCSDPVEHRRRIEMRTNDVPGLVLPTWQQVRERAYDAWDRPHLVLDTAGRSPETTLSELRAGLASWIATAVAG
jgi:predicted kinase